MASLRDCLKTSPAFAVIFVLVFGVAGKAADSVKAGTVMDIIVAQAQFKPMTRDAIVKAVIATKWSGMRRRR